MKTHQELLKIFLDYLENEKLIQEPQNLYEPFDYIMHLGGKRMRPILTLLAYQMFANDDKLPLNIAMAIEVFHNFSLVHDDVMDEAPLRRGKTTVHQKYNVNTAILSGDLMLVKAYEYLGKTEEKHLPKILKIFTKTAAEVCDGQQYDMDFEERSDVKIEEYLKMIELKTSVLVGAALQMGAIAGGASDEDAANLYSFGKNIGIAFQLQDDILDTFGNVEKFGKKVGGDIVQNKKTILILKTLEKASEDQKSQLEKWMSEKLKDENEKIIAVKKLMDDLTIRQDTELLMDIYYDEAFAALHNVSCSNEAKEPLVDIAKMLIKRES